MLNFLAVWLTKPEHSRFGRPKLYFCDLLPENEYLIEAPKFLS